VQHIPKLQLLDLTKYHLEWNPILNVQLFVFLKKHFLLGLTAEHRMAQAIPALLKTPKNFAFEWLNIFK
jgi:hypothetical protein